MSYLTNSYWTNFTSRVTALLFVLGSAAHFPVISHVRDVPSDPPWYRNPNDIERVGEVSECSRPFWWNPDAFDVNLPDEYSKNPSSLEVRAWYLYASIDIAALLDHLQATTQLLKGSIMEWAANVQIQTTTNRMLDPLFIFARSSSLRLSCMNSLPYSTNSVGGHLMDVFTSFDIESARAFQNG